MRKDQTLPELTPRVHKFYCQIWHPWRVPIVRKTNDISTESRFLYCNAVQKIQILELFIYVLNEWTNSENSGRSMKFILLTVIRKMNKSDYLLPLVFPDVSGNNRVRSSWFFEQYDLSVGFCKMPINIMRAKTIYILSTATSSSFLILQWNVKGLALFKISHWAYQLVSFTKSYYTKNVFKFAHNIQFSSVEWGIIQTTNCLSCREK